MKFEDRGTDRRTRFRNVLTDLSNNMTRLPKLNISWRRGKQYTSSVTRLLQHILRLFAYMYLKDFVFVSLV